MYCLPRKKRSLIIWLIILFPVPLWAFDYLQALPEQALIPASNPLSPAKIALGKKLFFDNTLLGPKSRYSCNSCHDLRINSAGGPALSPEKNGKLTKRSAPSLWNIGIQTVYYWDGRSRSLEAQTLDHLRDPQITNWSDTGSIIDALSASPDYQRDFNNAFPGEPVSARNLARAIASFERTLLSKNSRFDHFIKGDKTRLTAREQRGMDAFNEAGCLACHFGANFAGPAPGPALGPGEGFYELFPNNLGTIYEERYQLADDQGRYAFTGNPEERYMWRVPSLRNIEYTAPYFHNGSVKTLYEAVRVMAKTQFDKDLDRDTTEDIVAFLKSLSGELPQVISEP